MSCRSNQGACWKNCVSSAAGAFRAANSGRIVWRLRWRCSAIRFASARRALVIDLDDGAIGHEGTIRMRRSNNSFLHDEVMLFPFGNGLGESDAAGKRRGHVASCQSCGGDLARRWSAISAVSSRPRPLKRTTCAGVEPENVARVMGFAAAQQRRVGIPFVRRE